MDIDNQYVIYFPYALKKFKMNVTHIEDNIYYTLVYRRRTWAEVLFKNGY